MAHVRSALLGGALLLGILQPGASSQCVILGTPGLTGCQPAGVAAPSLNCNATDPTLGNPAFSVVATNIAFFGFPGVLVVGPCAIPPLPLPAGTGSLCPAAPLGCYAFVNYLDFFILVPPTVVGASVIWLIPIPSDASLVGATLCAQAMGTGVVSIGSSCFTVSNGLQVTILP